MFTDFRACRSVRWAAVVLSICVGSGAVAQAQPNTARLLIGKIYTHPQGGTYPTGVSFKVNVNCQVPSGPPYIKSAVYQSSKNSTASVASFSSVPVGAECSVWETLPTAVDSQGCSWGRELLITQIVTKILPPPAVNVVGIKNNYYCPGHPSTDLDITTVKLLSSTSAVSAFRLTPQNVGTGAINSGSAGINVKFSLPSGSTISGFGITNSQAWNCTSSSSVPQVNCSFKDSYSIASFAPMEQIEVLATVGSGTPKTACAEISMTAADQVAANNKYCVTAK